MMTNKADYIKSSFDSNNLKVKIKYKKLLSIHLQSNNPENFLGFIKSIETRVNNVDHIEVIVKIDDNDIPMNKLLEDLQKKSIIDIKYISTPLLGGFSDLWRSMNDMLLVCEKDTYFVWNMNDEMRIPIDNWDELLKKYVGLFPDNLFRLRTSCFRNKNYSDEWECCFSPETSAITTKKWIDICGDWNPTLGPDSFNQLVAYYFSYHDRFNKNKDVRDIVINDFSFEGEGASIGLNKKQKMIRMAETIKPWFKLLSHQILTEASRRSQKIKAHIYIEKNFSNNKFPKPIIVDSSKSIKVFHPISKKCLVNFNYRISKPKVLIKNIIRSFDYFTYAGGGKDFRPHGKLIKKIYLYLYFLILKNKLFKIYYYFRKQKIVYNKIIRNPNYYFFLVLIFEIKKNIYVLFKLPFFIFEIPLFIYHDLLLQVKNIKRNFMVEEKIIVNFLPKSHLNKKKFIITDCTHFLNRLNINKLYNIINKTEISLLNYEYFTHYLKIVMISKFYNIVIDDVFNCCEIYIAQFPELEKIFLNEFDYHLELIMKIDFYIKKEFDYNLRSFLN